MSSNRIIILAVLLVAAAQSASAASYYVATTGNDSNSGTAALPFRTVTRGVNALRPGDMLYIRGGTYAEAIYGIPSGTSWSAPITIASYPGETAVIQPGPNTGRHPLYLGGKSYLVFDRLVFDGSTLSNTGSSDTNIFIDSGSHHIRVQNSEVKSAPWCGILVVPGAYSNEFINLAVHDNGVSTGRCHGIYLAGSNNLVEKSDIYRNAKYGVHIYSDNGAGTANNNVIRNNEIHENGVMHEWGAGIILGSGNNNLAYNNLIWGNRGGGIHIAYGSPTGSAVYNNTISANDKYGISIESDANNSVIKNNILYQNSGTQLSNSGSGTQASANLIGGDPAFVNVSAHDFHLRLSSPAIDAGISITTVTTDFDGNMRPQGAAWDIGAFEFLAGGRAPLAPTQVIIRP